MVVYLFGSVLPRIYSDIGGVDRYVFFVVGYLIPNAALCPFVGVSSHSIVCHGSIRRAPFIGTATRPPWRPTLHFLKTEPPRAVIFVLTILNFTGSVRSLWPAHGWRCGPGLSHYRAHHHGHSKLDEHCDRCVNYPLPQSQLLTRRTAGQVFSGIGAGLNELIALAGTAEMVPIAKRGNYVAALVFTILPFCPSALWAQLITAASSWRFNGLLVGVWNFVGLILLWFCYQDPPNLIKKGEARKDVLRQVDYMGGFLSTTGVLGFMLGMQWGAQQVCPASRTFVCLGSDTDPNSTRGAASMSSFLSLSASFSSLPSSSGRSSSPSIPWHPGSYSHCRSAR